MFVVRSPIFPLSAGIPCAGVGPAVQCGSGCGRRRRQGIEQKISDSRPDGKHDNRHRLSYARKHPVYQKYGNNGNDKKHKIKHRVAIAKNKINNDGSQCHGYQPKNRDDDTRPEYPDNLVEKTGYRQQEQDSPARGKRRIHCIETFGGSR